MEDNKNATASPQISYTPLDTSKYVQPSVKSPHSRIRFAFEELWKNKALFGATAALIVLLPIYICYRHTIIEVIYPNSDYVVTALDHRLVCYYTFPSLTQPDALTPEQIDPYLCTHINVGFASILNNSLYLTEQELTAFNNTIALKSKNPDLKVMVSIGGAGDDNTTFSQMVVNHENRKAFIKSVDDFVRLYKCDGIDLDWEFPNKVPSHDDKQRMHFTQLLNELRNEINRQHQHKFIVSVAVAAPKFIVDLSYDVSYMNGYVDFVNVMTYDFHFYTRLTPITGLNAPLYSTSRDFFNVLNINYSVYHWVKRGMDKEKINVGLPTYGHTFELFNENNNGVGAPARGYGHLGSDGFADYNQICLFLLNNSDVNVAFDYGARSPYASKHTEWVSFDDETSLLYKTQFIITHKFGGAMVYSLNADDHSGRCKAQSEFRRFPLTNRVKSILTKS